MNTNDIEEAIETFVKNSTTLSKAGKDRLASLCSLAVEALEKQLPIKPTEDGVSHKLCPRCGKVEFGFNSPMYCENCGQRIKWE